MLKLRANIFYFKTPQTVGFMPMAESFYTKLFELAEFPFVTEVIKERRLFVERAIKYFIFNRQPISVLKKVSGKFLLINNHTKS